jgi:hypothetical protein
MEWLIDRGLQNFMLKLWNRFTLLSIFKLNVFINFFRWYKLNVRIGLNTSYYNYPFWSKPQSKTCRSPSAKLSRLAFLLMSENTNGFGVSSLLTLCVVDCKNDCEWLIGNDVEGRVLGLLLGAFAKLRKATVSFSVSVSLSVLLRLSVRTEQLLSHWTDIHEIWYLRIFRKSVEKIQV